MSTDDTVKVWSSYERFRQAFITSSHIYGYNCSPTSVVKQLQVLAIDM